MPDDDDDLNFEVSEEEELNKGEDFDQWAARLEGHLFSLDTSVDTGRLEDDLTEAIKNDLVGFQERLDECLDEETSKVGRFTKTWKRVGYRSTSDSKLDKNGKRMLVIDFSQTLPNGRTRHYGHFTMHSGVSQGGKEVKAVHFIKAVGRKTLTGKDFPENVRFTKDLVWNLIRDRDGSYRFDGPYGKGKDGDNKNAFERQIALEYRNGERTVPTGLVNFLDMLATCLATVFAFYMDKYKKKVRAEAAELGLDLEEGKMYIDTNYNKIFAKTCSSIHQSRRLLLSFR